jgi:hypothetical protein
LGKLDWIAASLQIGDFSAEYKAEPMGTENEFGPSVGPSISARRWRNDTNSLFLVVRVKKHSKK